MPAHLGIAEPRAGEQAHLLRRVVGRIEADADELRVARQRRIGA
jgi:hypothetical protein